MNKLKKNILARFFIYSKGDLFTPPLDEFTELMYKLHDLRVRIYSKFRAKGFDLAALTANLEIINFVDKSKFKLSKNFKIFKLSSGNGNSKIKTKKFKQYINER
jgi:hypothetical protein